MTSRNSLGIKSTTFQLENKAETEW